MGIKAIDLALPAGGPGPTALMPPSVNHVLKVFRASRTDLAGSAVKCVLPAQSSPTSLSFARNGASNAGTSATLTVTISDQTGVLSTGVVDVKANGDASAQIQMTNLPILEGQPLTGDKQISVVYAESGTASTSGGPWNIIVNYV